MKKCILTIFTLLAISGTAWAEEFKSDKYYVYCTAGGRPDVGNGTEVSNYLKNFKSSPSVCVVTPSGFSNRAEADKYARSLNGRCPEK